ncbi:MAG: RES domain-containing protein [Actinomycetota bacterium]|nr:RES domain-containing protein [Actinomycetota bacterium]
MTTLYRQCDSRYAFLWGSARQPEGRWHAAAEGPIQYLADTPDGAWAELLRHEEIRDLDDLDGIARALWAVELPELPEARPDLDDAALRGDEDSYAVCQQEAKRLRILGHPGLVAPSAAVRASEVRPWRAVGEVSVPGRPRSATVVVLFGPRPDLDGWLLVDRGTAPSHVLPLVRHFASDSRES